jgi:predicted tellurium resistance membrane protein TerC
MLELLSQPQAWVSLLTLTFLEIILGIDNIVFITILAGKLPEALQAKARKIGLALALGTRLLLLFGLAWMVKLTSPIFHVMEHPVSGRDLILLLGGLFLLGKATHEIHEKLEGEDGGKSERTFPTFTSVIIQIMLLDVVFSLDSVITAVGMVDEIAIMVTAVVIAMVVMLVFVDSVSAFIEKHPTLKILALSFLILIGFVLLMEGLHKEIPKGYIYFAMAFSFGVEMVNVKIRKKRNDQLALRQPFR